MSSAEDNPDYFFDELLEPDYDQESFYNSLNAEREDDEQVDAGELIDSLHLNVPELTTVFNGASPPRSKRKSPLKAAPKMTNLGLKMSQIILTSKQASSLQEESAHLELPEGQDQLVESYGQRNVRARPGKRGRPKGSVKDATTQFGRSSSTHALPPAVAALMGRANVAYVQKKYDEAVELYLQVVQRAPSSPEPYYSLGLVWEERGDIERAASYFLLSAHLQAKAETDLWRKIAALFVQVSSRKEQAIYALSRVIFRPDAAEPEIYLLRAKLHLELHQYRQVISSMAGLLRKTLKNNKESDFDAFGLVAKLALHLNMAHLAASVIEESLEWAQKNGYSASITYSHLNLLTELRGVDADWLGVVDAIEGFLVICYSNTGAEQGHTGWWILSAGERFERALAAAPEELVFAYLLACYRLGRREVGSSELMAAFEAVEEPKPLAITRQLTDALVDFGEYGLALRVYSSPSTTQMTPEMCLKMATAYLRTGEYLLAEETLLAGKTLKGISI